MDKKPLFMKWLAIGIIFFFIGTCIIPSVKSEQIGDKTIITVDDEPGDADFTSIKEAVEYSSPGDTIEVYSGTYFEQGIRIVKDNITLLGVSHELGDGDDSGRPFIKGNGTAIVIHIQENHVVVSNFTIENPYASNFTAYSCVMVGNDTVEFYNEIERNNITISDCIIRNTPRRGIGVGDVGNNIRIINNEISNCSYGISTVSTTHRFWEILNITGNVITDCSMAGITVDDTLQAISGNTLKRCKVGISLYPPGSGNVVYGNDFDNCPVGVRSENSGRNTITKNNFKNYSLIGWWFENYYYLYFSSLGLIQYILRKDRWVDNYWDTWIGIGPKKILGTLTIGRYFLGYPFYVTIPWVDRDWNPAQEPYDIP